MNDILVSVIIPVYNVEKYLEKCIDSILLQTYKNIEIILVDDGSTDNSKNICDDYGKKHNNIKVFHKTNGGLSDARNYGLERAKGKYISFVDSDDWIENDTIEMCVNCFCNNNIDIVCFGIFVDYDDNVTEIKKSKKHEIINGEEGIIYLSSFRGIDVSACNKMYKKNLFDDIRFPFGKKCEDCYIMYRIFEKANNIEILPEAKYHYFQRIGSITNNKNVNMDYIYAFEEQCEYIKNNKPALLFASMTQLAFAYITICHVKFFKNIGFKFKEEARNIRKYRKYVMKNKYLSRVRKCQFILFSYFPFFYKLFLVYKKR